MAGYVQQRAPNRSYAAGYRAVVLGGFLLAMAAAAAWLWLLRPVKDEALPSSEPVAADVAAAPAPPPRPVAPRPVPVPPSANVAAVGDTRLAGR